MRTVNGLVLMVRSAQAEPARKVVTVMVRGLSPLGRFGEGFARLQPAGSFRVASRPPSRGPLSSEL
jgi:hypothetical protein